jgi:general secretion pathway protein C
MGQNSFNSEGYSLAVMNTLIAPTRFSYPALIMAEKNRYSIGGLYQRGKKSGSKVLIPVLTLVLLLFSAQAAARLSWRLLDFAMLPPADLAIVPRVEVPVVSMEPSAFNTGLVDLHLFGRAGQVSAAPLTEASDLPPTTLDLILVGVIFSTSPGKSVAIVGPKGETTENEIYGIDDKLPGAAVLSEIHPDRVILRRGGRYETLAIDEPVSPSISSPPPKTAAPSRRGLGKRDRHRRIRHRGDGVN